MSVVIVADEVPLADDFAEDIRVVDVSGIDDGDEGFVGVLRGGFRGVLP